MTTNKFLTFAQESGKRLQELVTAISAFTGNGFEIVATDGSGLISSDLIDPSILGTTITLATADDLAPGEFVRIFDNTGTSTAGLADATTYDNRAQGYVLASTTAPANAVIYLDGIVTGFTGLTPGDPVYLSLTPGAGTQTAIPEVTGNINQKVGVAVSATEVAFGRYTVTRFG